MSAKIHKGDTVILERVITNQDGVIVNVTGATPKELFLTNPVGATVTKPLSYTTDGADGKVYYKTTNADLSVNGTWKWQVHIVTSAGEWHTDTLEFDVEPNQA